MFKFFHAKSKSHTKSESSTQPKDYTGPQEVQTLDNAQLMMYSIGGVIARFMHSRYGGGLSNPELMRKGMPYVLSLRAAVKHEPKMENSALTQEVHDTLMQKYPRLDVADWEHTALEELMAEIAFEMHATWRKTSAQLLQQKGYHSHYAHLPLYFLNQTEITLYLQLSQQIFTAIGFEIDLEVLKVAFREYAAENFYRYGFANIETIDDALQVLPQVDQEITGLSAAEQASLNSAEYRALLNQQLAQHNCVTAAQLRDSARYFDLTINDATPLPRSTLDQQLHDLLPY